MENDKKMNGNNNQQNMPPLKNHYVIYHSSKAKADILAETFSNISSNDNYNPDFLKHKIHFEHTQISSFTDNSSKAERTNPLNEPFNN